MIVLIASCMFLLPEWFTDSYDYHVDCMLILLDYQLHVLLLFRFSYRFPLVFSVVLFSLWGRVLPCVMHLTYTYFLWCTSDLGEEQVQQETEDSQQECLVDEAEEEAEV